MSETSLSVNGDRDASVFFSPDYITARARFRARAEARGLRLEAHPIDASGPSGEALTIDVARAGDADAGGVVIVSSGLHGVEGYFGAAVQLALLDREDVVASLPRGVSLLLLHALNPFGFAWLRRANEENVDLNRNFLRIGEPYRGSPAHYAAIEELLNPKHPPRRFDLFRLRSLPPILRHGMPVMKQAVAGGQFDFPRGLFFGGQGPSPTYRILAEHLGRWFGSAARVLHVDFHTGLGRWGTHQLLLDPGIDSGRFDWLRSQFGERVQHSDPVISIAYQTRGDLGAWCRSAFLDRTYDLLCAEFGTYPPLRVLEALRTENQAHFWGLPDDPDTQRAKRRLLEAFVPSDPRWRARAVAQGLEIIRRGIEVCLGASDRA
jgi:hypothetical protein